MAEPKKYDTPLLDELEKGSFPSFVTEIKRMAERKPMAADLLGQLEQSYRDKIGYWKHGGLVGVMGYGGGVIGRYSAKNEEYPEVSHFHTIRVNQPSGWFYNTNKLRELCDIWDRHGSGLTNMHGSTGDIVFLGTRTEELEPIFTELTEKGWDLGGSGSCMRTPSCCVGPGRCEWALYDTLAVTYQLTMDFQDEMHRPPFPYKFKFKMAGCPNDCVASIARADMSIIGTWRDDIKVDAAKLKSEYIDKGKDIQGEVCDMCPTGCMKFDGENLDIDNANCTKCMHCINVLHHALRPGDDRGACVLVGSKAPIVEGALLSSVIVPFIKLDPPKDGETPYEELMDLIERMWDFWGENGKNRERIGEMIQRIGLGNFLEEIEVDPMPEMIMHPRTNPYIFFEEYYEDDDEDE